VTGGYSVEHGCVALHPFLRLGVKRSKQVHLGRLYPAAGAAMLARAAVGCELISGVVPDIGPMETCAEGDTEDQEHCEKQCTNA
jgi:hypothetical protein